MTRHGKWMLQLGAIAASLLAGTGPVRAQGAQQQYVVLYGEVAPTFNAGLNVSRTLDHLEQLAKRDFGAQSFSVNVEIERPNFFSIVEVWSSAASYAGFTAASDVQQTFSNLKPYLLAPLDERDGNLVSPQ